VSDYVVAELVCAKFKKNRPAGFSPAHTRANSNNYYVRQHIILLDAARIRAVQRSSGGVRSTWGEFFILFFSCSICVDCSDPRGVKLGHNVRIGPKGNNRKIHRDSLCSFLLLKIKTAVIGGSLYNDNSKTPFYPHS